MNREFCRMQQSAILFKSRNNNLKASMLQFILAMYPKCEIILSLQQSYGRQESLLNCQGKDLLF